MKTILFALALVCSASVASAQGYGWRGEYGRYASPNPYGYRTYGYNNSYYGGYGGYIQQNNFGNVRTFNGYTPWTGPLSGSTVNFGNQSQTYFRYGW